MSQEPFQITECQIGRVGNKITYDDDGSMIFTDRFVSRVRLIDLLNGGSGGSSSSYTKELLITDWIFERHDNVYDRDFWSASIYYAVVGITITDITKIIVDSKLYVSSTVSENIEFEDILIMSDHIKIVSTDKVRCYINISTT